MHIACCGYTSEQKVIANLLNSKDEELKIEDIESITLIQNKFLRNGEAPVVFNKYKFIILFLKLVFFISRI